MKYKFFYKILVITLILLILISFFPLYGFALTTKSNEDVYDIILFIGQSNMVGSSRNYAETRYSRRSYEKDNIFTPGQYASLTQIKSFILRNNGKSLNFVSVKQKPNTVFEYMYLTNNFKEIDSTIKQNYGENLVYRNGTLVDYNQTDKSHISLAASSGTNMIPQFCKTYSEITGHKVIAVCAGKRGVPIEAFLPHDDNRNIRYKDCYVYEAIQTKFSAAVNLAEKNNLKIGQKFYVIAQGENDVTAKTTKDDYKSMYKTLHNKLKSQLGIKMGALVETSTTPGTKTMKEINQVHQAQEELINQNSDIILGSSYFYDRYVSTRADYKNCNTQVTISWNGKKSDYDEAYTRATYSRDPSINKDGKHNLNHYTSAALCKVGMDAATSLSSYVK